MIVINTRKYFVKNLYRPNKAPILKRSAQVAEPVKSVLTIVPESLGDGQAVDANGSGLKANSKLLKKLESVKLNQGDNKPRKFISLKL